MWNDNELLKAAVILELAKALQAPQEVKEQINQPLPASKPWPERRRFWHRRVNAKLAENETALNGLNHAKA